MAKINWEKVPDFLIWNKVKTLRLERKFKQIKVAAGADISISTLWMIESGYEKKVTDETKKKLAKFFKCDVDDIFPAEMIGNKPFQEYIKSQQAQKD
ncbi:hypothetical protein ES703_21929 [subsurface metagenome]